MKMELVGSADTEAPARRTRRAGWRDGDEKILSLAFQSCFQCEQFRRQPAFDDGCGGLHERLHRLYDAGWNVVAGRQLLVTNTWVRDGEGSLITNFSATSLITNFVQKGTGTLRVWWAADAEGKARVYANATWTVEQGVLSVQQSGSTSIMNNKPNLTFRLCEGTQLPSIRTLRPAFIRAVI
jgi:hypothetical protein